MSDLIDRNALIEDIETEIINLKMNGLKGTPRPCEELYQFIERIKEQPTVEAKPVVVGEWKYDWLGEYICSNCHERVRVKEVMGEPVWDWCPACGADMRKKVE